MKRILYSLMLTLMLGVGSAFAQTETIELGYVLWDSEIASTHVVAAVLIDELGYDVELTAVDTGPLWAGMARGDFDAMVSAWLPDSQVEYWEEFGDQVVDLGANLEGADLGWVVPTYVDVDSIADLNDNVDEFGGEVIGIDPGAGIMITSERAFEVYGLDDFTMLNGSDAAMAAALDRAVSREEPIIVTGWRPHWMWAAYDLKYLEDPEGVFGEGENIKTIVSTEFAENGPEDVLAFLDNFSWTSEDMGAVMLMIMQDDMEPFDAARSWLADNHEKVQSWLE